MLHILLSILKIIGIILLFLLGILLAMLLLVLFVPVRYQAEARIYEDQKVFAKIHWLFRSIGVDICFEEKQLLVRLKLLWFIPIQLVPKKSKKEKPISKKKKQPEKKYIPQRQNVAEKVPDEQIAVMKPHDTLDPTQSIVQTEEADRTDSSVEEEKPQDNIFSKMVKMFQKIIGIPGVLIQKIQETFEKLKYTIRSICGKITDIKGQYDYYMELLKKEQTKNAFSLCKSQLLKIIKHVMPGKLSGEFHVGLDDPAATGQLYGMYCASMMLHNNRVHLVPDFDKKIMEGQIRIKGRIRGITFVMAALKCVFDKNIRYLIKTLKQKQGGNHNAVR